MTRFAVVDVETTGLGRADRIVEISIVVADVHTLEVVDEFDSMINPMRDMGATEIHGLTASMVEAAPTFDEVLHPLAQLLDGSVLVGHNLAFDRQFIVKEFERAGCHIDPGLGICTLSLSHERLGDACRRLGIPLHDHHRALADARASLSLLRHYECGDKGVAATVNTAPAKPSPSMRTLRREAFG